MHAPTHPPHPLHSFGRKALLAELACFLVWIVSFSVFLFLWQDEDPRLSLQQLMGTFTGQLTVCDAGACIVYVRRAGGLQGAG